MDTINLTTNNYLKVCRFCLMSKDDLRILSTGEIATSRVAILYKKLMDIEINITSKFPMSFCGTCLVELKTAVDIREHFKKIEKFWIQFLNQQTHELIPVKQELDYPIFVEPVTNQSDINVKIDSNSASQTKTKIENTISNVEYAQKIQILLNHNDAREYDIPISKERNKRTRNKDKVQNTKKVKRSRINRRGKFQTDYNFKIAFKMGHCDKCGESFRSRLALRRHLYSHIDKKCGICKIQFPSITDWLNHQKRHYPNDPKITEQQKSFQSDLKYNYSRISCQHCDRQFIDLQKLFSHQRFNHRDLTPIECYRCKMEQKRMSLLNAHMKAKHRKIDEPQSDDVFCHICGVVIKWGNFRRHMKFTHANGKIGRMLRLPDSILQPIKCTYCQETFKIKNRLHRHVESVHPEHLNEHIKQYNVYKNKEQYISRRKVNYRRRKFDPYAGLRCSVCGIKFDTKKQLKDHSDVHKNYECEICRKTFVGKQNLDTHLKRHSKKDRPFFCEICNASYTREPHLKNHFLRKHTNDRPFACDICDKKFINRPEMLMHMKISHLKLKPYKCSYCDRTFSTKQHKNIHESLHTGEKSFKCKTCSKTFLTMMQLEIHIGRYHNESA